MFVNVTTKLFAIFNAIEYTEHQPCIASRLVCSFKQSDTDTIVGTSSYYCAIIIIVQLNKDGRKLI